MARNVTVKIANAGHDVGPFLVENNAGVVMDTSVSKTTLLAGKVYSVSDAATKITITSLGASADILQVDITLA